MDSKIIKQHIKELLEAQVHIWKHMLYFQKSMALKCAIQLGIPDTIRNHGKPMSVDELASSLPNGIHPTKASHLHRLMRFLVHSKFFSKDTLVNGDQVYGLTINSQLLLKDHPLSIAPLALALIDPSRIDAAHQFSTWFVNDDVDSPFHVAHGRTVWEHASLVPKFNETFNGAMNSDAQFVKSLLISSNDFKGLISDLDSWVDVGGGKGAIAQAIAEAYPDLKCTVFDLPHVVGAKQGNGKNLFYVAGDMFEAIPHANAVLAKSILHDWSDNECMKILERCREAIPSKVKGGKVIIIDMVLTEDNVEFIDSQLLIYDMHMVAMCVGGKERTENEWKHIFISAGFSEYKVFPILGSRCVIEVLP